MKEIDELTNKSEFELKVYDYIKRNQDFISLLEKKQVRFEEITFTENLNQIKISNQNFFVPRNLPSDLKKMKRDFKGTEKLNLYTLFNVVYYGEIEKEKEKRVATKPFSATKKDSQKMKINLDQWYVKYPITAVTIGVPLILTMSSKSSYDSAENSKDAESYKGQTKTWSMITGVSVSVNLAYYFYDDIKELFNKDSKKVKE